MLLFIDTETSGLPDFNLPPDHPSQPHIVQLAAWLGEWRELEWEEVREDREIDQCRHIASRHIASLNAVVRPMGWHVSPGALAIHGITTERARAVGEDLREVLLRFYDLVRQADHARDGCSGTLIAHNLSFDHRMLRADSVRAGLDSSSLGLLKPFCTMRALTPRMKLPGRRPGEYKWPRLEEAHEFCFPGLGFSDKHSAMGDLLACKDIYLHGLAQDWWR